MTVRRKLVAGGLLGVLVSLASAAAASPARFAVPAVAASTTDELVSELNRRWQELASRQQRAVQELGLRQWSQRLPDQGRALEQLTRAHQLERRVLEQQLAAMLEAEDAKLRAQQVVAEEQAAAARSELDRGQQAVRALTDETERASRRIAEVRATLAERLQGDEANYQRWAAGIQSEIQVLRQRIAATDYADEKQRRQSEIDRLAAEQARLFDSSRRWQEKLNRFAAPDLDARSRELQRVTERLTAARIEEARLSRDALEATAAVQELARRLSAVQQLRTQIAAP